MGNDEQHWEETRMRKLIKIESKLFKIKDRILKELPAR
uniref:Uncharacterized protein n=1 Tax=viral metagenome TaxID=1070528 RepID=A0A6C0KRR0_9ZZZZ